MSPFLATSAQASLDRLSGWFDSSAGESLLQEQSIQIRNSARRFHGDSLLWVGCQTSLLDTVRGCMIRNHFRLLEPGWPQDAQPILPVSDAEMTNFRADLRELPLPNNSLDAMVLHHGLETSPDPRSALRECARVLSGGGRLVICAFNPMSLWGLRRLYARAVDDSFSHLNLVSPLRLRDWLAVLGFDTEPASYLAYNLPLYKAGSERALWRGTRSLLKRYQVPIGGAYMLSAVKTAFVIRPDRLSSKVAAAKLAPIAYSKLSNRSQIEHPG